jgi:16S rRNA (guanine527-N7)-methyltransferase
MLTTLYSEWNEKINLISRKDIENLEVKHVLHSLLIGASMNFKSGTKILDVGTGGGFPGIPLAILLPEVHFTLIDSIGKKIKVVEAISKALELKNVTAKNINVKLLNDQFDFVVSRAVTSLPEFVQLVSKNIARKDKNSIPNGIIYLKGGDLTEEIKPFKKVVQVLDGSSFFEEEFFETKKILYLPI